MLCSIHTLGQNCACQKQIESEALDRICLWYISNYFSEMQLINSIQSILPSLNLIWVLVIISCCIARIWYVSIEKYKTENHPAFIGLYTKQYEKVLKTMPNGTYALAWPYWLDYGIFAVIIVVDGKIKKYNYTEHSTHHLFRKNNITLSFFNDIENPYDKLDVAIHEIIGDGKMKFKTHNILQDLPITSTLNQYIKANKINIHNVHIEPDPYYEEWVAGKKHTNYYYFMRPFIPSETIKLE